MAPASGVGTSALVRWTPRSVPAYDVGGGGGGGVDPARVAASVAVPRVADLPELPVSSTQCFVSCRRLPVTRTPQKQRILDTNSHWFNYLEVFDVAVWFRSTLLSGFNRFSVTG